MLISVTKAEPGQTWTRLFDGDPFRQCLQQPYKMEESSTEAVLEIELLLDRGLRL